ncbi:MAG: hypothetical protein ABI683_12080 [Ginsengibacter sp.]
MDTQSPGTFEIFFLLAVFLVILIPGILFLLTLQKTMNVVSPQNRKMPPSNVWLMLIPIFNIVWQFIMVDKIAESIMDECAHLNISTKERKPTYNAGLAWNICNLLSFVPVLGAIASLVTFILYWVKVNEFKSLMIANKDNYILDVEKNIFYGDKV